MSKMYEYSGVVTVTLRTTWSELASDDGDFCNTVKYNIRECDGLQQFTEDDIRDIEVEGVQRID